jgi:hydroxymethylpyrimidine pyrophosphatase-like HAD family hydrolase
VDCPRITCRPCANKSNWLGDKPVCRHGRCTLDGKPLPCYEECLQQSSAQAVSWQAIEAHCRHSCDNQELNEKHITHVYTDLDGTMLTDRGEIPPENLQAARRFIAAGGKLGVATGRMPDSASSQAHSLGANLPLIFGNGAVITEPNGKLIKMEIIRERGDVQAMCRMILRGECKTIYTAWGNPETGDVRVGMNECRPADKPGYGVVRIRARQCKQHARLLSDLPGAVRNPQTIIESGDGPYLGISIAARGVSKAAAIQFVADRLNIPLRNLAYFGDSGNDTGALKMVHDQGGACFAMKNGTPGVKSACPRQTPSDNNHGGVAAALQTLIPDHP